MDAGADKDDDGGGGIADFISEYKWWMVGGAVVLTLGGILISVLGGNKSK